MNHWTQTHVWAGYAGFSVITSALLLFLAIASKRIQGHEDE